MQSPWIAQTEARAAADHEKRARQGPNAVQHNVLSPYRVGSDETPLSIPDGPRNFEFLNIPVSGAYFNLDGMSSVYVDALAQEE